MVVVDEVAKVAEVVVVPVSSMMRHASMPIAISNLETQEDAVSNVYWHVHVLKQF